MTRVASALLSSVGAVTLTYAMFLVTACWKAFRANLALGFGVFPGILVTPAFWIVSAVVLVAVMVWKLR
jgi:uncharacterized membrane protein